MGTKVPLLVQLALVAHVLSGQSGHLMSCCCLVETVPVVVLYRSIIAPEYRGREAEQPLILCMTRGQVDRHR